MRHARISRDLYENTSLIAETRDIAQNAVDIRVFGPRYCEKIPPVPRRQNLIENKHVISYDGSVSQYVDEKIGGKTEIDRPFAVPANPGLRMMDWAIPGR
jgi:hypothetical protein